MTPIFAVENLFATANREGEAWHHPRQGGSLDVTVLQRQIRGGVMAAGAASIGENGKGLSSRWYPETRIKALRDIRSRVAFEKPDSGDILERCRAEIADRDVKPPLHLSIDPFGETDCAGLGDALQPCRDVDAFAHHGAVAFVDDIAEVNGDSQVNAAVILHARIALGIRARFVEHAVALAGTTASIATIFGLLPSAGTQNSAIRTITPEKVHCV